MIIDVPKSTGELHVSRPLFCCTCLCGDRAAAAASELIHSTASSGKTQYGTGYCTTVVLVRSTSCLPQHSIFSM